MVMLTGRGVTLLVLTPMAVVDEVAVDHVTVRLAAIRKARTKRSGR